MSIDPASGNATTLSDNNGIGSGSGFDVLRGITFGNGLIYATDVGGNEIFTVDPSTGNRTIVSGNGVGGTTFGSLTYGIAVYPSAVPEPASALMLILGASCLMFYGGRGVPGDLTTRPGPAGKLGESQRAVAPPREGASPGADAPDRAAPGELW